MRFLVMVKTTKELKAGEIPPEKDLAEMGKFNEEMAKAGIVLDDAQGLEPSSKGKRIAFTKGKPRVIDGPFSEAKEIVAGYWLLKAKSYDEVVSWMKRAPFVNEELEIRGLFEFDDFVQKSKK